MYACRWRITLAGTHDQMGCLRRAVENGPKWNASSNPQQRSGETVDDGVSAPALCRRARYRITENIESPFKLLPNVKALLLLLLIIVMIIIIIYVYNMYICTHMYVCMYIYIYIHTPSRRSDATSWS